MFWSRNSRLAKPVWVAAVALSFAGCAHSGAAQEGDDADGDGDFAGIVVLAASPGAGVAQGATIRSDARICLKQDESLTLLGERGQRMLRGAGCWQLGTHPWGDASEDAERDRPLVTGGSPAVLARFPEGSEIPASAICLAEGETIDLRGTRSSIQLTGAQCFDDQALALEFAVAERKRLESAKEAPENRRRARTGAVRGSPSSDQPNRLFVYHGSKTALARYPRGTRKDKHGEICLGKGKSLTLVSRSGLKLTYGEGCDKPLQQDKGKNSGATTLGLWPDMGQSGRALR